MILRRDVLRAAIAVAAALTARPAATQPSPAVLLSTWTAAERAYATRDVARADSLYRLVARQAHALGHEWEYTYSGNAYCGLVDIAAERHDSAAVRENLDSALAHHYWLFNVFRNNANVTTALGARTLDSVLGAWERVRHEALQQLPPMEPIVIRPPGDDGHRPLVIAFHGGFGNPVLNAWRWRAAAQELGVNVVVPPGVVRVSPEGFSWNSDIAPIDSSFLALWAVLERENLVQGRSVYLAGFSQGGHAALTLAIMHPHRVRGAVVFEGYAGAEFDSLDFVPAANNGVAVYCLTGEYGYPPFRESIQRARTTCQRSGIAFHLDNIPDMVHQIPENLPAIMHDAMEWIDVQRQFHTAMPDRRQ